MFIKKETTINKTQNAMSEKYGQRNDYNNNKRQEFYKQHNFGKQPHQTNQ